MIVIVLATILYLAWLIEVFWCGKILQYHTRLLTFNSFSLGVVAFFALFEVLMLPVVFFQFSTKIAFILMLMELIAIPTYCLFKKISLIPKKEEICKVGIIALFTAVYGVLFYYQTVGIEVFDSSYYMTRVLENSLSATFGGFDYKTGLQLSGLLTTYDYQGFYYFFSLIIKGIRPFLILEVPTSLYLWLASFIYFGFLAGLLFDLTQYFRANLKVYLGIAFILPYIVNYYNTALPFIGNTYRTLATACFIWMLYEFLNTKNNTALFLSSLCFVAGFSFSSSFLFLGGFGYLGLFFALVFNGEKDLNVYFYYVLALLPLFVSAALFAYGSEFLSTNLYSYSILIIYGFVLVLINLWKKQAKLITINYVIKGCRIAFVALVLGLVGLSFMERNGTFGYRFYFENAAKWDMLLSPFDFTKEVPIIRNTILFISILVTILGKKEKRFMSYLGIVFLLFDNPLVEPFVAQHLTNLVYARTFEIFINPFTLMLFGITLEECLKNPVLMSLPIIALCWISYASITNTYNDVLIPGDDYDYINKVEKEDILIANYLNHDIEISGDYRPAFVSQTLSTKALVPNGVSLISKDDLSDAPAYSDQMEHTDNEILVLFYPYEYFDQPVWIEKPDYRNACIITSNHQITYVIMRKDIVAKLSDDEYVNAWFYMRDCMTLELETDHYVVLKKDN